MHAFHLYVFTHKITGGSLQECISILFSQFTALYRCVGLLSQRYGQLSYETIFPNLSFGREKNKQTEHCNLNLKDAISGGELWYIYPHKKWLRMKKNFWVMSGEFSGWWSYGSFIGLLASQPGLVAAFCPYYIIIYYRFYVRVHFDGGLVCFNTFSWFF